MAEAAFQVRQALNKYCERYHYSGSALVGERLAGMGIPDHICAAAEIVCEVADEDGMDPRSCLAEGSVCPEHIAAVLGWLRLKADNLVEERLRRFAWHQDGAWFIHPEYKSLAESVGLAVERPVRCPSFIRPDAELPTDAPEGALLFATGAGECPAVCLLGKTAYADPVNVLPAELQRGVPLCGREWTTTTIAGVPVEIRSTGGDGLFMGVAVDTGQIMRFDVEAGRRAFQFPMKEAAITRT